MEISKHCDKICRKINGAKWHTGQYRFSFIFSHMNASAAFIATSSLQATKYINSYITTAKLASIFFLYYEAEILLIFKLIVDVVSSYNKSSRFSLHLCN